MMSEILHSEKIKDKCKDQAYEQSLSMEKSSFNFPKSDSSL